MKKVFLDKTVSVFNSACDKKQDNSKYFFSEETEVNDCPHPDYPSGVLEFVKTMQYKDGSIIEACIEVPYEGEGKDREAVKDYRWDTLENYFILIDKNGISDMIELFDKNNKKLSAEDIVNISENDIYWGFYSTQSN